MRIRLSLLCLLIAACNPNKSNEDGLIQKIVNEAISQPATNLWIGSDQKWHNLAKWILYTSQCDSVFTIHSLNDLRVPYSALSLNLKLKKNLNDTISFLFDLTIHDSIQVSRNEIGGLFYNGVGFIPHLNKFFLKNLWEHQSHNDIYKINEVGHIDINLERCLNQKKEKLHPWLRKEAKRRGFLIY